MRLAPREGWPIIARAASRAGSLGKFGLDDKGIPVHHQDVPHKAEPGVWIGGSFMRLIVAFLLVEARARPWGLDPARPCAGSSSWMPCLDERAIDREMIFR
jgi:hypothetical protein